MTMKNTGTFVQFPRTYSVPLSTANTNLVTPTTPGLLWVAGPDGSQIWGMSAVPTASVGTANQLQFFESSDGGTTFNVLPVSAAQATYTTSQATALPTTLLQFPGGVSIGPTNPLPLKGVTPYINLAYSNSQLSELTSYYYGGVSQGTANAQTLPICFNSSGTALSATPASGTIVDFVAGPTLTNTTTTTIAPGAQVATALKRTAATQLSANDITAGFRYRMIFDGTEWILLLTQRLYCAQGQAQANVFTAWGGDC